MELWRFSLQRLFYILGLSRWDSIGFSNSQCAKWPANGLLPLTLALIIMFPPWRFPSGGRSLTGRIFQRCCCAPLAYLHRFFSPFFSLISCATYPQTQQLMSESTATDTSGWILRPRKEFNSTGSIEACSRIAVNSGDGLFLASFVVLGNPRIK